MADPSPPSGTDERPTRPRRRLDARTVSICVCIALLAALAAALIVSFVGGGSDASSTGDDTTPKLGLTETKSNAPIAVPTDTIQGLDGPGFKLDQFKGKPVVLNFFSTACAPCVKEMPAIESVHQELGDQVTFIGVDVQDPKARAQGLVDLTGITYRTGWDPEANLVRDFDSTSLPTTVLIGADGSVKARHFVALTADDLKQLLTENGLLATTSTTTAPAATTTAPP